MKINKLEIACFNIESALIAQQGGADRIELCNDMKDGGTTPSYEIVKLAKKQLNIDLFVMIRPRGGNFRYSDFEFIQMKQDMEQFKKMGVNGFVFGILNADGSINRDQNRKLVELASPFQCTFHRAFDHAKNIFKSLEDVIDCGFKTILTSGQKQNAVEGLETLIELVKRAEGRIIIMPGGGVRSHNISSLVEKINSNYYHSAAIIDKTDVADLNEIKLLKEKLM